MRKIYHLSTCSTCKRIINDLDLHSLDFEFQDIKQENISESDLEKAAEALGGYEAVFSKRAIKYRSKGLNNMDLSEEDFKNYILEEYTFLKRPVIFIEDKVFAGNSKKVILSIAEALK